MGVQKELVKTEMSLDYKDYRIMHRDKFKRNAQNVLCFYNYSNNGGFCSVLNNKKCVTGMVEEYCAPKKFYKFLK